MNVCHITSAHPSTDVRIYTKMVLGLRSMGVKSTLVAPNKPYQENQQYTILLDSPVGRIARLFFFRRKVVRAALKTNPNIVHLHDPELFPYTSYFQKRGIKVVLDWHEDFPGQIKIKHWIPGILRGVISKMALRWSKKITNIADASITVTPGVVNKMHFAKPTLIRNFPTLRELPASIPDYSERHNLLYIGAVTPNRGSVEMAKAISQLQNPQNITLDIAGDISEGETKFNIKQNAKPATINCLGHQNRHEVASLLSRSCIGFCFIKDIDNYALSYPTKCFEYMMWGIPVVMSRLNSLTELFGDEVPGIFVDPNDVDDITHAIQWLLDNQVEAERMGLLGQKLIQEKLFFEQDLVLLLELYKDIL